MVEPAPKIHCRICGSYKLNKVYYALDLDNKVELYQIISRDGSLDQLIRPCECRGEFAYAHRVCLANWIETTKHEHCDICRFMYNITYRPRTFFDWIFETQQVKRSLETVCVALLIYYLCSLGLLVSRGKPNKSLLDVFVLSSSYIWIFACSLYIAIYSYRAYREFIHWRDNNRRVVVGENKNPQLDTEAKEKDVLKSSGFKP